MPIRVACSCGKSLRVNDELAGKRVRCPGCGERVTVPEAENNPNAAAQKPSGKAGKLCSCGTMLKADAVLCVKCGFDWRTGSHHAPPPRKIDARPRKGRLEKAIDKTLASPALLLLLGFVLLVCLGISIYGTYGIYSLRVGRVIDANLGTRAFEFPLGAGGAWLSALGGLAGATVTGWFIKRGLRYGLGATLKDLKRHAAKSGTSDLDQMIAELEKDKKELDRE